MCLVSSSREGAQYGIGMLRGMSRAGAAARSAVMPRASSMASSFTLCTRAQAMSTRTLHKPLHGAGIHPRSPPRCALAGPRISALLAKPSFGVGASPLGARLLSSTPQSAKATISLAQQAFSWVNQNRTIVMVVCGMSVVMYGFYRGSVRIMKFFFNVSDKQIFTLGFLGGIVAALAIGGSAVIVQRRLTFHVDDVYRAALRELRKFESVQEALGGAWRPGGFRGYAIESMQDALQGSERRVRSSYFEAPARRVQMIFMVRGISRDGMVSLESYKRGGSYHFEMLSLDLKPTKGGLPAEHIFLSGALMLTRPITHPPR
jgi:hypothetical protein